jgi:hypothetical protein
MKWITREKVNTDRVASPCLIMRFVNCELIRYDARHTECEESCTSHASN